MSTPRHWTGIRVPRGDGRRHRNVAVIVETSNAYARGILRGIHDFQLRNPHWTIYLTEHGRHEPDESFIGNWEGDGVIARIETEVMATIIKRMRVPTVDVSAARLIHGIPWVETNDRAIADQALEHLLDCGLQNVAFFGDPFYNWSKWRHHYFQLAARSRGLTPVIWDSRSGRRGHRRGGQRRAALSTCNTPAFERYS